MALPPKPVDSYNRLDAANNNPYDAQTNPYGLADGGHRQNWVQNAKAELDLADWVEALASLTEDNATSAQAAKNAAQAAQTAAETAADDAAASAERFTATSTSNNTSGAPINAGVSFTTQPGKAFIPGMFVTATAVINGNAWLFGRVNSYNDQTGVLNFIIYARGTVFTNFSSWNIALSGVQGVVGPESYSTPVAWSASASYSADAPRATVIYDGETYVCITTHISTGSFDPTKWRKIAAKGASPGFAQMYDYQLMYGN